MNGLIGASMNTQNPTYSRGVCTHLQATDLTRVSQKGLRGGARVEKAPSLGGGLRREGAALWEILKPHPDPPPHLLYQQKPQPLGTRQKTVTLRAPSVARKQKEKIGAKNILGLDC